MVCLFGMFLFFFFKQKTAYEMRISDWSSDVCSSDLLAACVFPRFLGQPAIKVGARCRVAEVAIRAEHGEHLRHHPWINRSGGGEIGRASCRERVGQYV